MHEDIYINTDILSVRAVNALRKAGYKTLSECISITIFDLLKMRNVGNRTAKEILNTIESYKRKNHQSSLEDASSKGALDSSKIREYRLKILSIPISKINLSARAMHVLNRMKVITILDLAQKKIADILRVKNCGKKTLKEIDDFLRQLDLQLGEKTENALAHDVQLYISGISEDQILNDFKQKYPGKYDILKKVRACTFDASKIKFYKSCFHAYQEGGTLKHAAKRKHLTKERIRQILIKGTELGLFNYVGREYPYIEKNKILNDYSTHLSLGTVAKINGIKSSYFKRLLTAYEITDKDLKIIKERSKKNRCIELYRKIETELGHSPTTTELQNKDGGHYLSMKISHLWGSIDAFREELQIPKPVRTFPEASREWQEKRKRIAFIVRMQKLDQIRECLTKTSPLGSTEIAIECNMESPKALRLLNLLLARGEIAKEGSGSSTKYVLKQN